MTITDDWKWSKSFSRVKKFRGFSLWNGKQRAINEDKTRIWFERGFWKDLAAFSMVNERYVVSVLEENCITFGTGNPGRWYKTEESLFWSSLTRQERCFIIHQRCSRRDGFVKRRTIHSNGSCHCFDSKKTHPKKLVKGNFSELLFIWAQKPTRGQQDFGFILLDDFHPGRRHEARTNTQRECEE